MTTKMDFVKIIRCRIFFLTSQKKAITKIHITTGEIFDLECSFRDGGIKICQTMTSFL